MPIFVKNPETGEMEERLNIHEAAAYLGIRYGYLRIASAPSSENRYGEFPEGYKVHRSRFWTRSELDAWKNSRERYVTNPEGETSPTVAAYIKSDQPIEAMIINDKPVQAVHESSVRGKVRVVFQDGTEAIIATNKRIGSPA